MSQSPMETARMCGYMMTVKTFEIMCEVTNFVGIGVHSYVELVDVFTMTLMYGDAMEENI